MAKPHHAINTRKLRSAERRSLEVQLKAAIKARDMDLAEEIQAKLEAIAPKSNGRSSSSVCRDPYDRELELLYKNKGVHQILGEYSKEVRTDFGFKGAVAGIADLVDAACATVGEQVSPALQKQLCCVFFEKFTARTHGMGMLFVERGNQILVKLYEHAEVADILGLPTTGERPWIRRKPLGEINAEFARRWAEYQAGQVDTEPQDSDAEQTDVVAATASAVALESANAATAAEQIGAGSSVASMVAAEPAWDAVAPASADGDELVVLAEPQQPKEQSELVVSEEPEETALSAAAASEKGPVDGDSTTIEGAKPEVASEPEAAIEPEVAVEPEVSPSPRRPSISDMLGDD